MLTANADSQDVRIAVYEYMCGGGLAGQPLSPRWVEEGWAMLAAVVEDLAAIAGVEVHSSLDARLADRRLAAHRRERIETSQQERQFLKRAAAGCDGVLVLAPEIDGLLSERCRWVESAGGQLLGPSSAAVALAADKFGLNQHLGRRGVAVPRCCLVDLAQGLPAEFSYPAVLKPRFGAGSECVFLISSACEGDKIVRSLRGESGELRELGSADGAKETGTAVGNLSRPASHSGLEAPAWAPANEAAFVLEEYVPGQAASVSLLIGPGTITPLMPGEQRLSSDGRFHYQGGRLPLSDPSRAIAVALGCRAAEAVPGLKGYVGVDLVLAESSGQGSGVEGRGFVREASGRCGRAAWPHPSPEVPAGVVIEINPRLTTSYVGLRALANGNLAEWMLKKIAGQAAKVAWKSGIVHFDKAGKVEQFSRPTSH